MSCEVQAERQYKFNMWTLSNWLHLPALKDLMLLLGPFQELVLASLQMTFTYRWENKSQRGWVICWGYLASGYYSQNLSLSLFSCEVLFLEGKRVHKTYDKEVKSVALRTLGLEPGQGLDACYSKLIFLSILACTWTSMCCEKENSVCIFICC